MTKLWKMKECIMSDWLYQIRIKVSEKLSEDLRGVNDLRLSNEIIKIATDNSSRLVCTFDAFAEYCEKRKEKVSNSMNCIIGQNLRLITLKKRQNI